MSSSNSEVLNSLVTRYRCIRNPNEHPIADGDGKYLTSLWVFGNQEPESPPPPPTSFTNLMVEENIIDTQMVKENIISALKVLRFREPRVFIQFWSPVVVGKRCLLSTLDQPFGLGMVDEGLYLYRSKSERRVLVSDGDCNEKELAPPARVYQQKRPEWSFDVHGLSTGHYVQDWATCYDIHGYIVLPVFDPTSGYCVGVLELVTSSNYVDYAFEVQEISRALKGVNLKCPNVFEDCKLCVSCVPIEPQAGDEGRQHELDEIFKALKMICESHTLPLVQTWGLSGYSGFVANYGNLKPSCSSFNRSCIGKVCMSTAGLPFYVRDLSMWGFREACGGQHLEKSQGVVGHSLASRGSYFCEDVTKLSEVEYPLIHFASMHGVTCCLAFYLKSIEADREYVIELLLPPDNAIKTNIQSLVITARQQFENSTMLQLGNMSSTKVIGGTPYNWNLESQLELENEQNDVDVLFSNNHMEEENSENDLSNTAAAGIHQSVVPYSEKEVDFDVIPGRTRRKHSAITNDRSRKRKKTDMSIGLEEIRKYFGRTMDEAACSLRVSRSTLKRTCRNYGIPRWPYCKGPNESDPLPNSDQWDVDVHASEKALSRAFGRSNEPSGTPNRIHDPANLDHSSTYALQQQKQANVLKATTLLKHIYDLVARKDEDVVIKAAYQDNILKFPFSLSDGLAKLEQLVATRFQLCLGSFCLKYLDEDGDKILIACDSDLGSLGSLGLPNRNKAIKLFVQLVA